MSLPWNDGNVLQFSAPPKIPRNPRKRNAGKIRTRWLGKIGLTYKTRRSNTSETKVSDLDNIDRNIEAPVPIKVCDSFDCHAPSVSRVCCILHPKNKTGLVKTEMELRPKERMRLTY